MKICITGGSGILGTALLKLPGEKVFIDRVEKNVLLGDEQYIQADIRERDKIFLALEGAQVLIHCAGSMGSQDNWDKSISSVLKDNIEGLIVLFELAKECGVERIIFASSNHAVGMYEVEAAPDIYEFGHGILIDENVPARPDSFYGVSKVAGEAYGRFLAENGGPRCYALRIGSVRSEKEDHPYAYAEWGVKKGKWPRGSMEYSVQENRLKALWMSRRDFVHMIELLLKYDGPSFDVFNAVSDNDRKWLDISKAKEKLGFIPQDNAEGWVQVMTNWERNHSGTPVFDNQTEGLNVATIIPIKIGSEDNIEQIKVLLKRTYQSVLECNLINRVFVSTNSIEISEYAKELGIEVPFLRDPEMNEVGIRADQVIKSYLDNLEDILHYNPDLVAPLEITYPFRPKGLLSDLILKLLKESLNTVIAGYPEHRPAWVMRKDQLHRVDAYEQNRDDREPLHIGLASLGCVTYTEIMKKGTRMGNRIGVLEIEDPIARMEIRSGQDYTLFEKIINTMD
jgi:NAD+ dependent glucose-6-phosphate dehydrogenase